MLHVTLSMGDLWSSKLGLKSSLVHQGIMFLQASYPSFLVIPFKRSVEGLHTSTKHSLACWCTCMLIKTLQGTQHDQYALPYCQHMHEHDWDRLMFNVAALCHTLGCTMWYIPQEHILVPHTNWHYQVHANRFLAPSCHWQLQWYLTHLLTESAHHILTAWTRLSGVLVCQHVSIQ